MNAQPVRAVNRHADVLGPETERDNVNDHITRRYCLLRLPWLLCVYYLGYSGLLCSYYLGYFVVTI